MQEVTFWKPLVFSIIILYNQIMATGSEFSPPTLSRGQRRTARLFEDLGFQFGHYAVQMHGEDRTERSISLLREAEDPIKKAIFSGRRPEGRMGSIQALHYFNGAYHTATEAF